ncbi:MAG: diguanylate cyclase [Rhodocyclaceae bacterium]|nr:MAG: diguanylate cyclase [Rhodocyclaceae bacterium]
MRIFVIFLLALFALPAQALEQVVLQLNWKHQFQFGGYYAAIEKGYFRDAGFEVSLRELSDGHDPIQSVLSGEADFGVAASELALHRAKGEPVVALATIVQNSPLVLLVNRRKVTSIDALNGGRIMLTPHETELFAYLRREGIANYTAVAHSYDPKDLISGRVDALSAYLTDEPYVLREAGFPYLALNPSAVGIHFYGDTLFTTEARARQSAARVRAFRAAAIEGWAYAMAHPDEIAELILKKYSKRHTREHLLFEANELKRLMQPELVEIGQQSAARWQQIAQTYAELEMLPEKHSIAGLIFEAEERKLPSWFGFALTGAIMLIAAVAVAALYFARLTRSLSREMITRRVFERALRTSEERYRQLAEHSKDVIWTLDLNTRRFTYVSPSIEGARGFTPEEVVSQPLSASLQPESYAKIMAMLDEHLGRIAAGDQSALSAMTEVEQPHKNGGTVVSEVVASFLLDAEGKPHSVLGVSRNITERRRVEAQLREANEKLRGQLEQIENLHVALQEQAIRDSLTGCFNRRYLDETLERELSRSRREGYPLSLVILDLDHFKQINDTYGHQAGDQALVVLAETLRADIRHEDVLCRYGGEEFIILMPHMPLATAAERAEAWRQKIADIRVPFGKFELTFTTSAGVAAYPDHGKTPDELSQSADLALYLAKNGGRNRVVVFSAEAA